MAVDEVTAGQDHHGVAVAALILPESLSMGRTKTGPIRGALTRKAAPEPKKRVDTKAPAAPARRPGQPQNRHDFTL